MERLTYKGAKALKNCGAGCDGKCDICDDLTEAIAKLKAYEDAEEQGLLLRLPCKMGDTVYVLEPCHCYNKYKENQNCNHAKTKATKYIEVVRLPRKYDSRCNTYCVKLYERPFKIDYLSKIGKSVFLTKEEAEQKLAEMRKE